MVAAFGCMNGMILSGGRAYYAMAVDGLFFRRAAVLNRAGYASPVRTPRGRDILAACGQLKSASERLRARARQSDLAAVE